MDIKGEDLLVVDSSVILRSKAVQQGFGILVAAVFQRRKERLFHPLTLRE